MPKRIALCVFSMIAFVAGCGGGDNSNNDIVSCDADNPCGDDAKVCVNRQCIDRCSAESCSALQYCGADGLCADRSIEGQTCSDAKPCISNLICSDGVCVAQNSNIVKPCDEAADCSGNMLCVNNICIARCTAQSCKNGQICASSGFCADGADVGGACGADKPCLSHLTCQSGACRQKPCSDANPCSGENEYCSGGTCVAKCDDAINPCAGRLVCGDEGKCIEPCYAGVCPSGTVCGSPKRVCIPGECSWYDDCPDASQICDFETNACVAKCSKGTCGAGKVCGDDRRCFEGECSAADPCAGDDKVCDDETHACVVKCGGNEDCGADKLCYADGLCRAACSKGSCAEGTVCGADGICIPGECSDIDGCDISYKVCDNAKCVDKCKKNDDCGEGKYCNASSGLCRDACTAASCPDGKVCGEDGYCISGECSSLTPCAGDLVCSASHECVTETFDGNECYFYADCSEKCDCAAACSAEKLGIEDETKLQKAIKDCQAACKTNCSACNARNKLCPDGKQCNAFNQCIDENDKKGLGESCALNKECDDDLICVKSTVSGTGVCKSKAYAEDRTSCSETSFQDRCVGNIIVECVDGMVQVQDCKTFYQDYSAATLANFYGNAFGCVSRPGSNYVMCAKLCGKPQLGDEWHVCGWDIDDPDLDFSDRYVCKYNDDGRAAYFPADSQYCTPSCNAATGQCE